MSRVAVVRGEGGVAPASAASVVPAASDESAASAGSGRASGRWSVRLSAAPIVYARLALGSAFLSAVAARFGLWDGRPEPFAGFVAYTGEVLSFLPRPVIPACAVAATVAETTLGVLLVVGFRLRETAAASAVLLAVFGVSMAISGGIKSPLDASVFSASAAALLLSARAPGEAAGPAAARAAGRNSLAGSPTPRAD